MNPIDPRKNEKAFVMAAVFCAISGDIALTRFVGGTASRFTVMSGVACTVAVTIYLVGILWSIHEDGKRRR